MELEQAILACLVLLAQWSILERSVLVLGTELARVWALGLVLAGQFLLGDKILYQLVNPVSK